MISHLGRHLSSGHFIADVYEEKQANWVNGALRVP
jgi:hypothetical protein